jgi:hypothetical protein
VLGVVVAVVVEEILVSANKASVEVGVLTVVAVIGVPFAVLTLVFAGQTTLAPLRQRRDWRAQVYDERDRLDEQAQNWRDAFDRKYKETEDLRGQLGDALLANEGLAAENEQLQAELDRLLPLSKFPDLVIKTDTPLHIGTKDGTFGRESLIAVKILVVNRERERKAILRFPAHVQTHKPVASIRKLGRTIETAHPDFLPDPLKLSPQDTAEGEVLLTWDHTMDFVVGRDLSEEQVIEWVIEHLSVNALDELSGVSVNLNVGGRWERGPGA